MAQHGEQPVASASTVPTGPRGAPTGPRGARGGYGGAPSGPSGRGSPMGLGIGRGGAYGPSGSSRGGRGGYHGGMGLGAKMANAAAAQRQGQGPHHPMHPSSGPSHHSSPGYGAYPPHGRPPPGSSPYSHPDANRLHASPPLPPGLPLSAPLPPSVPPPPPPPTDAPPPPPDEPPPVVLPASTVPLAPQGESSKAPQDRVNFFCKYDPQLDSSVVKKGGAPVYRNSKPPTAISSKPNRDPRLTLALPLPLAAPPTTPEARAAFYSSLPSSSKGRLTHRAAVEVIPSYPYDSNSIGPPPPPPATAILVSALDRLVTTEQVRAHFAQYGRVAECEIRLDPHTGGSLGLCWLRFVDEVGGRDHRINGRHLQDGHAVAKEAVKAAQGARIGIMLTDGSNRGIKCELDGDGKRCRKAVDAELARLHPHLPKPSEAPIVNGNPRLVQLPSSVVAVAVPTASASKAASSSSSTNPSASPASTSATSHGAPQPTATASGPESARDQPAKPLVPTMPSAMRNQLAAKASMPPAAPAGLSKSPPTAPQAFFGGVAPRQGPQLLKNTGLGTTKLPMTGGTLRTQGPIRSKIAVGFIAAAQQAAYAAAKARNLPLSTASTFAAPMSTKGKEKALAPPPESESEDDDDDSESEDEEVKAEREKEAEREALIRSRKVSGGGKVKVNNSDISSPTRQPGEGPSSPIKSSPNGKLPCDDERPQPLEEVVMPTITPGGNQTKKMEMLRRLSVNGKMYITIDRSYLGALEMGPRVQYGPMELKRHFFLFRPEQVMTDGSTWYISFYARDSAPRAHSTLNMQPFMGFPVPMKLCEPVSREGYAMLLRKVAPPPPPTLAQADSAKPAPARSMQATDDELVRQARGIIMADLRAALVKDLKTRVVSSKVWEILRDEQKRASDPAAAPRPPSRTSATPAPALTPAPEAAPAPADTGVKLPTFARRRPARGTIDRYVPNYDHDRRRRREDDTASVASSDLHHAARRASTAREESHMPSDDELAAALIPAPAKPPKALRKKKPVIDWTSSEDEDEAVVEPEPSSVAETPQPEPVDEVEAMGKLEGKKKGKAAKGEAKGKKGAKGSTKGAIEDEQLLAPIVLDEHPAARPPLSQIDSAPAKSAPGKRDASQMDSQEQENLGPSAAKKARLGKGPPPRRPFHGPPLDPFDKGVAEDEEDLYYVQMALGRFRDVGELHPDPLPDEPEEEETGPQPHASGCARAEGYYAVTTAQKAAYLPQRNKAIVDVAGANSALAVSRSARVNTRRFVTDMQQQKRNLATPDHDVVKFNQLRTRKKQLHFSRSPIHDWGLYAREQIPVGDMVIEYVGEVIRQAVADRREKAYERVGIGSSYLFRVDDDLVVDATKKGNLGRLINHCCTPNCTAKIITISGEKKIVIYAKATIEAGDEVTYDYHFPKEDIKIPCLCGSAKCKGTLN